MRACRFPQRGFLRGRFGRAVGRLAAATQLGGTGLLAGDEMEAPRAQQRLDDAVNHQVGVTPDRAREVRVGLEGEAEMPVVGGGVNRLLHRTQQHGVDLCRINAILCGVGDGLKFRRLGVVAQVQAQAQCPEVTLQRDALFWRRALVHAVQRRVLTLGDEFCRTDVGREHGLFDQLVGFGAHARHDLLDVAVGVANDLRLGRLEVDRTALLARLDQRAVDLVQVQKVRHQLGPPLRFGAARIGQHRSHFGVGQPRV